MKYLFIAWFFLSCNQVSRHFDSPPISNEVLDTVKSVPVTIGAKPVLFETAFVAGTTQKVKNAEFQLYGIAIGKIKIGSGRIVICDPLHTDEYGIPFTQVFPKGEFPVQLSIAKLGNEEITAFARILFSDKPVARWEFALQKGQRPIPIGGEKMHGYGVDGGVAIIIDDEALKALDQKTVEEMEGAVFKEMDNHYHHKWKYAMYNFGQHNLAGFSTGFGDGRYPTYVGYDAEGTPCRLVTDFRVFDWKENK